MSRGRLGGDAHGAVVFLVLAVAGATGLAAIAADKEAAVPGVANVWVDRDGGSCIRSEQRRAHVSSQACATVQLAAKAAAAGDVVLVADGTYPGATLSGSKRLTIQGAGPGRPSLGQVVVSASNQTLRRLLVENRDDQPVRECGYALLDYTLFVCGARNTFDDVIVDGLRHGAGDPARKGGLQVTDTATGLVFENGEIRNVWDSKGFQGGADNMVVASTYWHDIRLTPAGGAAGVHNECAYVTGGDNQTWRGNRFVLCPVMAMFFPNYAGGPPFRGVVVEHNVFTHALNEAGAWHDGSSFVIPNGVDGQNQVNDWVIRYNTFEVPPFITSTPSTADDNGSALFYGNLGADGDCGIPEWTYSYNVGETCGGKGEVRVRPAVNTAGRPNQAPFYADAPRFDFRLRAGAAAIDRGNPTASPRADADGSSRPIGGEPDAGAYEYGTGVVAVGGLGASEDARRRAATTLRRFQQADAANLLVTLGNNDAAGSRSFASSWRSSFAWLRTARIDVAGALGAGDAGPARHRYVSTLAMPAPFYVRRLRDVEVIVLDSTRVTKAQTAWLQRTLSAGIASFRMVVLHHPPFSCADDAGDEAVREQWVPLFERHGVRLVIAGHAPGYQRFRSGRLTYVVGTVGSPEATTSFPRCPRGYPRRLAAKPRPAFVYVTAASGRAHVRAVDLDGRTIDRFRVG